MTAKETKQPKKQNARIMELTPNWQHETRRTSMKQTKLTKLKVRAEARARMESAAKAGHDIAKAYSKYDTMIYWELCDKGFGMDEKQTDQFIEEIIA